MMNMTISKVARKASVGVETVRFYERRGLIEQPPKPKSGGFRIYPEEAVARIRFIRQAQELGFSLREIEELLSIRIDPAADCADVRAHAQAKFDEVKKKIAHLRCIGDALEELMDVCPGTGAIRKCSIMEALTGVTAEGHAGPTKGIESDDQREETR